MENEFKEIVFAGYVICQVSYHGDNMLMMG